MLVVFVAFILVAVRYQFYLLDYLAFGDEAETVVAAKMMVSGQHLYSDIFNHHGPLTFLSGYLLERFGSFGISGHRVPIAVLQIVAMAAVYYSTLLQNRFVRQVYVLIAASVMLLFFSEIFGSMYLYQVIAGLFLVIILSQYTLPAIVNPDRLSVSHVVMGNVLIGCLPFLAVTYVPVASLLFLASLRKRFLRTAIVSIAVGVVFNLLFLVSTGSIAGYLAYHIYLNSQVLSLYNGGQNGFNLILTAFHTATANLGNFCVFAILVVAIARLASVEKNIPWRAILVALGASSLLIRGLGFHGLPFLYFALAIPLVFFIKVPLTSLQARFVLVALGLVCLFKLSLLFPGDKQKIESVKNPTVTEFSHLVQRFTNKDDKIIAYSFNNHEYIAADRLPASGYYFYLPWQEKYNENPQFGISIDPCKQIASYRPKVMIINKWQVWGKYNWETYGAACRRLLIRTMFRFLDALIM